MNMTQVRNDIRDEFELDRRAALQEAQEVDSIGGHYLRTQLTAQEAIDAAAAVLKVPQFSEPESIVILHALIVGLRRHNMHLEDRKALVHELSVLVQALDEESVAGMLEDSIEAARQAA